MKKIRQVAARALLAMCFHAASALATAGIAIAAPAIGPEAVVKSTSDDVLDAIKTTKDKRVLRQLAEQKVLPKFDFKEMTKSAVGPAWRNATPAQQQSLESAFRTLLINTYTAALNTSSIGNEPTIEVRPAQLQANQTEATVKTVFKQRGKQPVAIDYRMMSDADSWKVVDVLIEGISLVTTYRSDFSAEVQRAGLDGLIKTLDTKNQRLAAG